MVAQFYPMPFPDSRPLLGVCCAAYFTASSVLQLIVTYLEKDCIMTTAPVQLPGGGPTPDAGSLTNASDELVENTTRALSCRHLSSVRQCGLSLLPTCLLYCAR
jgi:hypothetical protein